MISSNFLNSIQKKIDKLDIQTTKNVMLQLIDEIENLKTVFDSMKEAVIVLDEKINVSFYNKMAIKILKIIKNNPIGIPITEFIENENLKKIIKNALKKEEPIKDFEFLLDFDPPKYIDFSIHPLVKNGKIIGSIIILDDVTKDKENKNKLRQAESLAALTTISAGIAHEIKNPLGAMDIHVQLVSDELERKNVNVSDDFKFSINAIKEEIKRLNNIVVDYLYTVRPLKAKLILVNLHEFLDNFIDFILPEVESYNIILKKNYKKLPNVWLDEKYFKQALLNLIKNSIGAIKNNGIIEIESYQEHNYVIINIIDNGEGITDEVIPKIFDPYFTTKNYGTGLGLTIVYKIIREHKGQIEVTSKNNRTIFSIKLPLSYIEKGQIEYSKGGYI